MSITTENTFETTLVQSLVEHGEYTEGNAAEYIIELGMFSNEVIQFLKNPSLKIGKRLQPFMVIL